jgi:hypothetical protein
VFASGHESSTTKDAQIFHSGYVELGAHSKSLINLALQSRASSFVGYFAILVFLQMPSPD